MPLKEPFHTGKDWTSRALLEEIVRVLEKSGLADARRNAEWIMCECLDCTRVALYTSTEHPVLQHEKSVIARMVTRRLGREPIQYILGYTEFMGLRIEVTPDVLIPRPETEQVVAEALDLIQPIEKPRILDIGTGSGCIAIAIKHERPDADMFACDISEKALSLARSNAVRQNLAVSFLHADVLFPGFHSQVSGPFELIISNPPYVVQDEAETLEPEVVLFEPEEALFVDKDPLQFYRAISRHAHSLLVSGGYLVFETHAEYGPDVRNFLTDCGFRDSSIKEDWAGLPRIVTARR